jgi:hypothetical protein
MPIPEKLADVFNKVSNATKEGRAAWKPVPIKGMYFLTLGDFSVQLWKKDMFRGNAHTTGVATSTSTIAMNLLNADGKRFEGFTVGPDDPDFDNMVKLVESASSAAGGSTAHETDQQLTKFKQQLTEKLGI